MIRRPLAAAASRLAVAVAAPALAAALALVGCSAPPPPSPLEPVDPLVLYPTPRYVADARLGIRVPLPAPAFDTTPPPDLPPPARAAWDAGGVDRYVVISRATSRAPPPCAPTARALAPSPTPPRRRARSSTPPASCTW